MGDPRGYPPPPHGCEGVFGAFRSGYAQRSPPQAGSEGGPLPPAFATAQPASGVRQRAVSHFSACVNEYLPPRVPLRAVALTLTPPTPCGCEGVFGAFSSGYAQRSAPQAGSEGGALPPAFATAQSASAVRRAIFHFSPSINEYVWPRVPLRAMALALIPPPS